MAKATTCASLRAFKTLGILSLETTCGTSISITVLITAATMVSARMGSVNVMWVTMVRTAATLVAQERLAIMTNTQKSKCVVMPAKLGTTTLTMMCMCWILPRSLVLGAPWRN